MGVYDIQKLVNWTGCGYLCWHLTEKKNLVINLQMTLCYWLAFRFRSLSFARRRHGFWRSTCSCKDGQGSRASHCWSCYISIQFRRSSQGCAGAVEHKIISFFCRISYETILSIRRYTKKKKIWPPVSERGAWHRFCPQEENLGLSGAHSIHYDSSS